MIKAATLRRIAALPGEAMIEALLFLAEQQEESEAKEERRAEIRRKDAERKRKKTGNPVEIQGNSGGIPVEIREESASRVIDNTSLFPLTTSKERKNPPPSPSQPLSDPQGFEEFWDAYPKRDGDRDRKGAVKAFRAARKRAGLDVLIAGALAYSRDLAARGKLGTEFVRQARTWLNNDGWNESYDQKSANTNGAIPITDSQREEIIRRLQA